MSSYEIRVPEALMLAHLPWWVKMVWISVRSFQGRGDACYAKYEMIGERTMNEAGKAMDKGQVSRAISALIEAGFLERVTGRSLRCIEPEKVDEGSTLEAENSTPKVDHPSTKVDHPSTKVDESSTPSKNQHRKPTLKTKRASKSFSDDDWQMVYAVTAYDHLTNLNLLPQSLARKRAATLQAFADEFDKLRRLDEFDQDTIREVMRWLLSPTNWWIQTANFRSVLKLRKPHKDGGTYFEHFLSQVRTNARPKQSNHTSYSADDAASIYAAALAGASSAGA